MDIVDYLKVLRRRWRLIAVAIAIGGVAAYFTAPAEHTSSGLRTGVNYQATATLLQSPNTTTPVNVDLVRLYITSGDIPQRAAQTLHFDGTPAALVSQVAVGGDDKIGSITITATGGDGTHDAAVANAFADATIDYLRDNAARVQQQQTDTLNRQITELTAQLKAIEARLAGSQDSGLLKAQHDATQGRLSTLFAQLQGLQEAGPPTGGMSVLSKATPVPMSSGSLPLTGPTNRPTRTAVGLVLAALLAAGAALVIERFDTRLRSRAAVEDAFRLPVVAEVPLLPRSMRRDTQIAARQAPQSAAAEGYRAIRAALYLMPSLPVPRLSAGEPVVPAQPMLPAAGLTAPRVVLVTSATAQSGKTRTVANLAACIAETGKSVLVIDCDLRNPSLARYLDVDGGWGLSDVVAGGHIGDLSTFVRATRVRGVSMVSAGTTRLHPAVLLARMREVLDVCRELADVVLLDSPPILGTSDAIDLMPHVDSVVVVAWAGRTRREQAERCAEILSRLGVPVLGVALVTPHAAAGYVPASGRRLSRSRRSAVVTPSADAGKTRP